MPLWNYLRRIYIFKNYGSAHTMVRSSFAVSITVDWRFTRKRPQWHDIHTEFSGDRFSCSNAISFMTHELETMLRIKCKGQTYSSCTQVDSTNRVKPRQINLLVSKTFRSVKSHETAEGMRTRRGESY